MESQPNNDEARKGKFDSSRDELLYLMAISGWFEESSGDTQASTGWFARMSNLPEEMPSVSEAFSDEARELDYPSFDELQGHFLIVEDGEGFVHVTTYESQHELVADFRVRQEVYESEGSDR